MKKIVAMLLALALAAGLAACGGSPAPSSTPASGPASLPAASAPGGIEAFADLAGKNVAVNSVPISAEQFKAFYANAHGIEFASVKVTPTVLESTMMVQNGQVDGAITPVAATAEYFARQNADLRAVISDVPTDVAIALDAGNTELQSELNGAIRTLKEDGTIDKLAAAWVDNVTDENLKAEPQEKIEGADTLYIGISGDVAPLDYVSADGTPAGFNVALMNEIGRLLGKNIEFVVVSTDAKFSSILSGKIDAFFWHISILPLPETIAVTDSYYSTYISALVKQ